MSTDESMLDVTLDPETLSAPFEVSSRMSGEESLVIQGILTETDILNIL
jgi:hypothetical protein